MAIALADIICKWRGIFNIDFMLCCFGLQKRLFAHVVKSMLEYVRNKKE